MGRSAVAKGSVGEDMVSNTAGSPNMFSLLLLRRDPERPRRVGRQVAVQGIVQRRGRERSDQPRVVTTQRDRRKFERRERHAVGIEWTRDSERGK